MTVNKRSKSRRYRGSKTHGCGSMKKRRGAGHRGGRGNAGSGKRSDCKRPSYWNDPKYFGRYGFNSVWHDKRENDVISLGDVQDRLKTLVELKFAVEKSGKYEIDLTKLGISKLLSQGKVTQKLSITVEKASRRAIEKIQEAGGEIIGAVSAE